MQYRSYTEDVKQKVRDLFEDGKNKCEISRLLGIPRATLRKWIENPHEDKRNTYIPIDDPNKYLDTIEKRKAYSFSLALYFCDGYISTYKTYKAARLQLVNDNQYPLDTLEWQQNIQTIFPDNKVSLYRRLSSNATDVQMYSRKLPDLFPQLGPGKKHDRKIELADWQRVIIEEHPEQFIRACFQTDGCIYLQKVGKYAYKRYTFVNKSKDITEIFLYALSLLGIKKDLYWHSKGIYCIQNFQREHLLILEKIISCKN